MKTMCKNSFVCLYLFNLAKEIKLQQMFGLFILNEPYSQSLHDDPSQLFSTPNTSV